MDALQRVAYTALCYNRWLCAEYGDWDGWDAYDRLIRAIEREYGLDEEDWGEIVANIVISEDEYRTLVAELAAVAIGRDDSGEDGHNSPIWDIAGDLADDCTWTMREYPDRLMATLIYTRFPHEGRTDAEDGSENDTSPAQFTEILAARCLRRDVIATWKELLTTSKAATIADAVEFLTEAAAAHHASTGWNALALDEKRVEVYGPNNEVFTFVGSTKEG